MNDTHTLSLLTHRV